jgi:hypothetical protein
MLGPPARPAWGSPREILEKALLIQGLRSSLCFMLWLCRAQRIPTTGWLIIGAEHGGGRLGLARDTQRIIGFW